MSLEILNNRTNNTHENEQFRRVILSKGFNNRLKSALYILTEDLLKTARYKSK